MKMKAYILGLLIQWIPAFTWRPIYSIRGSWRRTVYMYDDDDPFNANLHALMSKLQDDDRLWLKEVLGSSLSKLLESIEDLSSDSEHPSVLVTSSPSQAIDRMEPKKAVQESVTIKPKNSSFVDFNGQYEGNNSNASAKPEEQYKARYESSSPSQSVASVAPPSDDKEEPRRQTFAKLSSTVPPRGEEKWGMLRDLGYSRSDIDSLKESIIPLIIKNQVQRPIQLPPQWIRKPAVKKTVEDDIGRDKRGRAAGAPGGSSNGNSIPKDNSRVKRSDIPIDRYIVVPEKDGKFKSDTVGNEVRWSGVPLTDIERAQAFPDDVLYDEGEEYEEEEQGFWPNEEEFKELLLEESKFRIDTVGKWIAPYLRNENKWRLGIYNHWLRFLDEGMLGDKFDVLDEDFGEEDKDEEVQQSIAQKSYVNVNEEIQAGKKKGVGRSRDDAANMWLREEGEDEEDMDGIKIDNILFKEIKTADEKKSNTASTRSREQGRVDRRGERNKRKEVTVREYVDDSDEF